MLHLRASPHQVIAANEVTAVRSRDCGGGENRLEDFFPFDPIHLKGAAGYIHPLYQQWGQNDGRRQDGELITSHQCSY